jgi:hypothetical protein
VVFAHSSICCFVRSGDLRRLMDARLPADAALLFLSFCLPLNAWNPHLDILSSDLIRYRTNLRSTNRQPKMLDCNPTDDHSLLRFTGGFEHHDWLLSYVQCTPVAGLNARAWWGISIDRQIYARCLIFAVRNLKRRGWLLIGAKCMGLREHGF